jgi:hypothetical protein
MDVMEKMEKPQPAPKDLRKSIERMDALLAEVENPAKHQAGLGIRLALGMAQELQRGKPLGAETGELVAAWMEAYGQETVDAAVGIAREFLLKPEDMKRALAQGLDLDPGDGQ